MNPEDRELHNIFRLQKVLFVVALAMLIVSGVFIALSLGVFFVSLYGSMSGSVPWDFNRDANGLIGDMFPFWLAQLYNLPQSTWFFLFLWLSAASAILCSKSALKNRYSVSGKMFDKSRRLSIATIVFAVFPLIIFYIIFPALNISLLFAVPDTACLVLCCVLSHLMTAYRVSWLKRYGTLEPVMQTPTQPQGLTPNKAKDVLFTDASAFATIQFVMACAMLFLCVIKLIIFSSVITAASVAPVTEGNRLLLNSAAGAPQVLAKFSLAGAASLFGIAAGAFVFLRRYEVARVVFALGIVSYFAFVIFSAFNATLAFVALFGVGGGIWVAFCVVSSVLITKGLHKRKRFQATLNIQQNGNPPYTSYPDTSVAYNGRVDTQQPQQTETRE
jgi:hypothetical protein